VTARVVKLLWEGPDPSPRRIYYDRETGPPGEDRLTLAQRKLEREQKRTAELKAELRCYGEPVVDAAIASGALSAGEPSDGQEDGP
jgi:hypothetical protein